MEEGLIAPLKKGESLLGVFLEKFMENFMNIKNIIAQGKGDDASLLSVFK